MKRRKPTQRKKPKAKPKNPIKDIDWASRYDYPTYRKVCAIAHSQCKSRCVVCWHRRSVVVHHSRYLKEKDTPGVNVFPVCVRCHKPICHSIHNWIENQHDPLWGNHNTASFERRLQVSYQLLKQKNV
jgi:hypothetical protein